MKQNFKVWIAVITLVIMTGCNGQWASSGGGGRNNPRASEDEVRQQFEKLMGAFARRDIAGVNDIMDPNATFINAQMAAGVLTWAAARPILTEAFAKSSYQLTNDAAYRIGVNRDLGWIATVYHVRIPSQSGLDQSDGGISVLFQKNPDGYKVLLFHASHFSKPGGTTAEAKPLTAPKAVDQTK